jgi:ABC-type transport system involved in cytochrome c biogenesis permease subunit
MSPKFNLCYAILFFFCTLLLAGLTFYSNYQGETLLAVFTMVLMVISMFQTYYFLNQYEQSL